MTGKKLLVITSENRTYLRLGDNLLYLPEIDRWDKELAVRAKLLKLGDDSAKIRLLEPYVGKCHTVTIKKRDCVGELYSVGQKNEPPIKIKKGAIVVARISFDLESELYWDLETPVPAERVFVTRHHSSEDSSVSDFYASGAQFDRL